MRNKIGVLLITVMAVTGIANAQTVTTVPSDGVNDRFTHEYFPVIRPGLSMNGFDNGGNDRYGLGLKQVLNAALSGGT